MVVSISLKYEMAMNTEPIADYSYGKRSHGKFRIPINESC